MERPSSWTRRFDRYFATRIRERGLSYYHSGAVDIWSSDSFHVDAKVVGRTTYRVRLRLQGRDLRVDCTCPYFDSEYENCKHIWAAMVAAEREGKLAALVHVSKPRIIDDALDDIEIDKEFDEDAESVLGAERRPTLEPAWKRQMKVLSSRVPARSETATERGIGYVIEEGESGKNAFLLIRVVTRRRKKSGDWGVFNSRQTRIDSFATLPDEDRRILGLLAGAKEYAPYGYYHPNSDSRPSSYQVPPEMLAVLMPIICGTGRCYTATSPYSGDLTPVAWDDGPPWEFWLQGREDSESREFLISGSLRRGEERVPLGHPSLLAPGVVFFGDRAARFDDSGAFAWIPLLREDGAVTVPAGDRESFLQELLSLGTLPRLDLPPELRVEQAVLETPCLHVLAPSAGARITCELRFDYGGTVVSWRDPDRFSHDRAGERFFWRDSEGEREAVSRLREAGFKQDTRHHGSIWTIRAKGFAAAVGVLLDDRWKVEATGKPLRRADGVRVEVRSGIDWFDLDGSADFGGQRVGLPQLLKAAQRGDHIVNLGDGTVGLLPQEWLEGYRRAAALAGTADASLRFSRSQVALLDFLLASEPEAVFDDAFVRLRDQIRDFRGVRPSDPGDGFIGTLRDYQREGLGWLKFLERFGFGGCLADDMGLGKTVQVLALLATKYAGSRSPDRRPSLVVAPRSLIFNWRDEALRFAPGLRVIDYTGMDRKAKREAFDDHDIVLTTYGTLRRDASFLKEVQFDTLILDEAQAIKNVTTASAKAARLLKADHRLALSGTPVENHIGELWSVFEVLNPGMLGSIRAFDGAISNGVKDDSEMELLSRALRPFILRRTKGQVAPELPKKTEQTVYCEMKPPQRRLYDELRTYYRQSLLSDPDDARIRRSKIKVLEALLRLRQAACHPGLLDKTRAAEPSAKLDALIPQLLEVIDGGSKALVFSQFTSLLRIVRERLDRQGIEYEYLDGRTRNRSARVERFQNDPSRRLFLISLKAGGLGLNLTAAEYVFILDPWWNPAVEAQAIDRTHRIGQNRKVFAYRLIARDTVEDRILELQQTKRSLADAIISSDNSLISTLSREHLEILFS